VDLHSDFTEFDPKDAKSPFMTVMDDASKKAAKKVRAAQAAMDVKIAEDAAYAQRLVSMGRRLSDVLELSEGGKLAATEAEAGKRKSTGNPKLLMLENGGTGASSLNPLPREGLLTILRPSLRALAARLHAIRAECKACGMRHAGNFTGTAGEDLMPRLSLQPLDDLITEVITRLDRAIKALQAPLHHGLARPEELRRPAAIRQREVMALEDDRWNISGTAVNAELSPSHSHRRGWP